MKKSLYFAFLLLTLLAVCDAKAQNYSSEMGGTCNGTGIWCRALNSDADIYTEVYDESAYEFNDYSEYGDFSQEVVHSDGTREHINYGSNEGSASYGNQNQNDAVAVGYSLTRVDGKYLKDNIWYRTISYVPPSGATMCTTIPQYYPFYQTVNNECVLCASATIANIMGYNSGSCSDYKEYINTYRKIYDYTKDVLRIDLYEQTPDGNPEFYYNMIHNIGGVPVNMTNASDVTAYIDNGSAVLGVWSFPSNYVELNPSRNYHMVTIVGYDDSNYYCIDPCYISPQTYPISDFDQDFYYGYPILP